MISEAGLKRVQQLNKQLAMYRAFRDVHGAAAVLRELQMNWPYYCPAA